MFRITLNQAANAWCVYVLTDETGKIIFIWYSKLACSLSLRDALSNPNLDENTVVTFSIIGVHLTKLEAQNAMYSWLRLNDFPILNRTIRFSHYGPIKCNETGQVYRSQAEAARVLGLNQAPLSQHLRRNPGYKSVKGMTFSIVTSPQPNIQPAQHPAVTPVLPTITHPIQFPSAAPGHHIWTAPPQNPSMEPRG